jgi:hypothetical protein
MTDTPEAVASNAALIERMNLTVRVWEADEHPNDWWQYQRDFAEALRLITATRPADTPTGNPYIDLDVGSITVPIGYVRKMVDALATTQATFADYTELHRAKLGPLAMQHGAHSPEFFDVQVKVERNREMADMCAEALALGQSVITAFDQEAERG